MDYDELTKAELIAALQARDAAGHTLAAGSELGAESDRLLHELQVHQIELEAQNQALREAQGQLEESSCRYLDLYDFAPIAYCTFDRAGVVLEINLTGAAMLGKERALIVGKPFLALVRLEKPESLARHIRSTLEATVPIVSEIVFASGRALLEVQFVSAAIANPRGEATSCRTALIDVSQRRSADRTARAALGSEKALRGRIESLDRASAAVSAALAHASAPDGGEFLQAIVDEARKITHAQYAAVGIGSGRDQPLDRWVYSGLSSEQVSAIGPTPGGTGMLGAMHDGKPIRLRDLLEHGALACFPSHDPAVSSLLGVPISYEGDHRGDLYLANKQGADEFSEEDLTLIKMLAERAGIAMEIARLRQVEAREHDMLKFLANAGSVLAESIDYDDTLRAIAHLVVPAAADLTTLALVQENGALRTVVAHHRDPSKQALLEALSSRTPPDRVPDNLRAVLDAREPQRQDAACELGADETRDCACDALRETCSIVAPLVVRGQVIGLLRLMMAESGRRYTDADLPLAREIAHHAALAIQGAGLYRTAQTAIRARDTMLAVVSHDLRNYLSTISMGALLLSDAGPSGERRAERKQIDAIQRSAKQMNQLIDSLRDATMIETGHFTIEPTTENVALLVEEAVKILEPQTDVRSVRLKVQLEDPSSTVHCDRARVLQIIANLVGNAIKFTPKGGEICIAAKAARDGVCFSVSDTGSGIPSRELAHVFDQHWAARPGTRNGTGLGLFIAKGIAQAHGGSIWVESQVGVGSTFHFTLPIAPARIDQLMGLSSGAAEALLCRG